jgi:hypothetical protein
VALDGTLMAAAVKGGWGSVFEVSGVAVDQNAAEDIWC